MSSVNAKKPSKCASKAKKNVTKEKEQPKDYTMTEEIALCQAWCDVPKISEKRNGTKDKGFWEAVSIYFEKKTSSTRGYDSILSKWRNKVRPIIGRFGAIINNIEENHKSGSCDLNVYQKTCVEYKLMYKHDFTLEACWNILKDHQCWLKRPIGRDRSKVKKKSSASSCE
nr:hypothetical protein [Tanacetum cinerariifolium]